MNEKIDPRIISLAKNGFDALQFAIYGMRYQYTSAIFESVLEKIYEIADDLHTSNRKVIKCIHPDVLANEIRERLHVPEEYESSIKYVLGRIVFRAGITTYFTEDYHDVIQAVMYAENVIDEWKEERGETDED